MYLKKKNYLQGAKPVIQDSWESEIRGITIQSQPKQVVCETSSQPIGGYSGIHLSSQAMWEAIVGKIAVPGQQSNTCLTKWEALSSNPSITKKS
jgi:hypothetical protein